MNTSNDNGTSSNHQQGIRGNSELAIDGLLNGIKTFGTEADSADDVFKHVFDVASGFVGQNGKEEDLVFCLEDVVEYIQKTPDLAGSLLHCHVHYRIAQVLTQQKHMKKAKQYLYCAQKIAASRRLEAEYLKREIGVWEALISLHENLGEKKRSHHARMEYLEICEPLIKSPPAWLGENIVRILVGVARACFEIGSFHKNEEPVNTGIRYLHEALHLEKDKTGASKSGMQSWILLQLSEFYYSTDSEIGPCKGQVASWDFLQQAIAGLQQVECTCSSNSIDSSLSCFFWEGKKMLEICACHQSLAEAYLFQGKVLQHHGFMEETQKSFELGLDLVEKCNDRRRKAWFRLELAHHLLLKTHLYTNSSFHFVDIPQYTGPIYDQIVDHFREFLKQYTPSAVFVHDQMAVYARAIINAAEDPNVTSNPDGFRAAHVDAIQEQLQMAKERGDEEDHADRHECLSVNYYRLGNMEACISHYNLAYNSCNLSRTTPLRAFQTFGWLLMGPKFSSEHLQQSYAFWEMVFKESVKLQELMTGISEDHAIRYFELSKRACMSLAKCEMLTSKTWLNSQNSPQSYVESALVWAERGKGRMLMSFIEASAQSNDVDPASQFDTQRFLTDATFARNFICNVPQDSHLLPLESSKTIFIEQTFLDHHKLMINLIVSDPCSGRTIVQHVDEICLHSQLPEGIRLQAEIYLDEVLQDCSEAVKSSTDIGTMGAVPKVLSAMNKCSTNRKLLNPWILGMIAGIQMHIAEALKKLKDNPDLEYMEEYVSISELLQNLFKVLIKPIKEQLEAVYKPGDTLIFVPHEDLGNVPFAALHEKDGSRYLIEDYAISVSPSIWCTRHCQFLYEKMSRPGCDKETVGPVLVGKKSGYPKPGWKPLKQAHREVDAVAEAMRAATTAALVLKDDESSPDGLSQTHMMEVLPRASWIHLSVHGEVSSQFPQGSLLFSDNDGQRLTAEQIMTLAQSGWRARAVVASACQTGLGAVAGGGILGFARVFMLAGVPSSILTVWEAPATFCTEFMKKLYEHLALGYSLAHSMQKVMITMIHEPKNMLEKRDRKGKGKVGESEGQDLKWTILDWACFGCFGLPSVTLPKSEQLALIEPDIFDGTASSSSQCASVEKSEEFCITGYDCTSSSSWMWTGLVITSAVQGLLLGIVKFDTGGRGVLNIPEYVFNISYNLAGCSGSNEEDVVIHLEKVVEYIEHNPWLAGSLLHCNILFKVAQVFALQKSMEKAKQYHYSAQKIASSRRSALAFLIWEIGIWEKLISIHDTLGEEELLLSARKEYIKVCELLFLLPEVWLQARRGHYKRTLVTVGKACFGVGRSCNDMEQLEDGINYLTEALGAEGEKRSEIYEQGMILMQLSEYYYHRNSEVSKCTSLILLEQAIAGLQEAECTCSSDSVKSSLRSIFQHKPEVFGCGLHQLLADAYIFQGKVSKHMGHTETAKESFHSALVIVAKHSDTESLKREFSVWENLVSIHDQLEQLDLLFAAKRKYIEICELMLLSPPAWRSGELRRVLVKVGRACFDIGIIEKNSERIEEGINYLTEALRVEGDAGTEASEQAWILMQLAKFHYQTSSESSVYANWILLEQAIAGYQQVKCTCNSESSDGKLRHTILDELPEMSGCGCHQLLADAYIFLGNVQQNNGFLDEAQKNFEHSLDLVKQCNDKARESWVEFEMFYHSTLMKPYFHTNTCLHMFKDSPELQKIPDEQILYQNRFFLKKFCSSYAAFNYDQLAIYIRAVVIAKNDPKALSNPNGFQSAMAETYHKQLLMAEEKGDYEAQAVGHEFLSVYYHRMGDVEACKKHYHLAYKFLDYAPSKSIIVRVLQTLGWIAMTPEISDYKGADFLWQLVFHETVKLQDKFTEISEDHALRYYEHSKYACMALALSQMRQAHKSRTCPDPQKLPESAYADSALVWAERGKGRMLMSFIEASTQSNDIPASQFDTRSFLTDDTFAFKYLRNTRRASPPLSQSRRTIFIEYTYLDRLHLLIHLVIDDPISRGTFVLFAGVICLVCELPDYIRKKAQGYLTESVQQHSEMAKSSSIISLPTETVLQKVVSALNKYSTNTRVFNPWIPGMVVGIQKHVGDAIDRLKRDSSFRCMNEKAEISELLQNLFKVLIKPIQEQLEAVYKPGDTLVFVPHEDLSIVPFAALHEKDGSRYLIEDYAISVSPSIWCTRHCQFLYEKMSRPGCDKETVGPVLVGKKSGYPKPGWKPLKQAHREVDAVAEAMRAATTAALVLKDDESSPDGLSQTHMMEVLPRASWIHLSVHGEVSSQFPQGSLLFSDNDGQRLTAEQIMTLAQSGWRARAVVASACQTGLGAVAGGGILGFARAFMLAGVPSSILTVWEAPATFCTEFMKKLYEHLALGYSLAHAMQKVTIIMIHAMKPKVKGEARKLKWTIFDWACLGCFGLPSVTLPNIEQRVDSS